MRTFLCIVLVLLVVTIGSAFYFGVFAVTTERQEAKYLVSLEINTDLMKTATESAEQRAERIGAKVTEGVHGLAGGTTVKGTVATVAHGDHHFTVTTADYQEAVIYVDASSRVAGTLLKGLQAGDHVNVVYTTKDGKNIARTVTIEPGA